MVHHCWCIHFCGKKNYSTRPFARMNFKHSKPKLITKLGPQKKNLWRDFFCHRNHGLSKNVDSITQDPCLNWNRANHMLNVIFFQSSHFKHNYILQMREKTQRKWKSLWINNKYIICTERDRAEKNWAAGLGKKNYHKINE